MHLLSVFSLRNRALIALLTIVVGGLRRLRAHHAQAGPVPVAQHPAARHRHELPRREPRRGRDRRLDADRDGDPGCPRTSTRTVATSTSGASTVSASFTYGTNIATAEQKVQLAINRLIDTCPTVPPRSTC